MAAEILRHQSSMAYYDNNHSGCMWGLLRFLDLHKHLHKRKMLSYRSHGDEKHGRGTKILTSAQNVNSSDQEQLFDKGINYLMENKRRVKKRSSGKAHFLTLLYKKMTKKKDRKLKISSSTSQLLRTISIHHLECNDYVLSDSIASDSDSSSTFEDYSARSENISLLHQGSEGTFDERRLKDVIKENKKEQQISMDGVLDKIPIDGKLSNDADGEKRSKFGSKGFVYINSQFAQRSIQRSRSLTETSTVRGPQTLTRKSNSFKEGGNNFSERRFLRTPSLSDSLDRYSYLFESISARDPQRSNSTKEQDNNHAHRRTLRSHSLTESFLLESVLVREPQQVPRRSNSVREKDSSFTQQTTLRSRSLTDSSDVHSCLLESVSKREHKSQPVRLKSISEEDSFSCNLGLELDSLCKNVPSDVPNLSSKKQKTGLLAGDVGVDSNSSDEQNSVSVLVNKKNIMGTETLEHHNDESTSNATMEVLNQPELINVHYQAEECIIADDLIANDDIIDCADHEDTNDVKEDPGEKPTKPMPVSVLGSHFEADPISPSKYAVKQGVELHSSWTTFEKQDYGANSENKKVEFIDTADIGNTVSSRVMEDAEFNYVKGVLQKSGFDGGTEEFLAAWYSSYEPVDQLLFVGELDTIRDDYLEIPPDRLLLLDLINEILLDIYENTIALSTGLSSFSPRIRPMPVGDHVLEEVWLKVKWHRNSQRHMNTTLEQLEARDFAKSDGWMNLLSDVESVGIELVVLTLEDLIDEIIVDFQDV